MNIFFHDIKLQEIVAHQIGSKAHGEGIHFSQNTLQLAPEVQPLVLAYFLDPFKDTLPLFHFREKDNNPVFQIAEQIFENPSQLFKGSVELLRHQYDRALHPKIKRGEVYVNYFRNVKYEDQYIDAIGIFKSERKETFLKVFETPTQDVGIEKQEGINIKKLDKGCLIYNTSSESNFRVQVIDKTSPKSEVAKFWQEDFLDLEQLEDDFFHTNNYLELCKSFCNEVLANDEETHKNEELMVMSKSLDYFCESPNFSQDKFEEEVFEKPDVIENFQQFKEEYEEKNEVKIEPSFHIHKEQAMETRKKFRSIIKLDKNFHIYIHGDQDYIERGFDSLKQKNYYKVFFDHES